MKAAWQRLATAIDALALRERLFVFVAALMLLAAAADALWLSPLWNEHKAARAALQRESAQAQSLREQLRARVGPTDAHDPATTLRTELAGVRAELDTLARESARLAAADAEAAKLPELLRQVLKRHERLTLVKLATLEPAAVSASAPAGRLRGVELTLAGRYADLARDLATLEQSLPGLRWGALHLAARPDGEGATLTVHVFLGGGST